MDPVLTPDERIADLERQLAELRAKLGPPAKPSPAELAEIARYDNMLRIERLQKVNAAMHGPAKEFPSIFEGVQLTRGALHQERLCQPSEWSGG